MRLSPRMRARCFCLPFNCVFFSATIMFWDIIRVDCAHPLFALPNWVDFFVGYSIIPCIIHFLPEMWFCRTLRPMLIPYPLYFLLFFPGGTFRDVNVDFLHLLFALPNSVFFLLGMALPLLGYYSLRRASLAENQGAAFLFASQPCFFFRDVYYFGGFVLISRIRFLRFPI